jgi:hypothetical protein
MATYLPPLEKLRYRALFTIHVLACLNGIFDLWPGVNEPDAEAARCELISENITWFWLELSVVMVERC